MHRRTEGRVALCMQKSSVWPVLLMMGESPPTVLAEGITLAPVPEERVCSVLGPCYLWAPETSTGTALIFNSLVPVATWMTFPREQRHSASSLQCMQDGPFQPQAELQRRCAGRRRSTTRPAKEAPSQHCRSPARCFTLSSPQPSRKNMPLCWAALLPREGGVLGALRTIRAWQKSSVGERQFAGLALMDMHQDNDVHMDHVLQDFHLPKHLLWEEKL